MALRIREKAGYQGISGIGKLMTLQSRLRNLKTRNRPTQNALAHAMLIAAIETNAGA
jgi:hypothetical protein